MKKILICCFMFSRLAGQTFVKISDPYLASYLAGLVPTAMSGGSLNVTDPLVTTTTQTIFIQQQPIKDLHGIQYFTSLRKLFLVDCHDLVGVKALPASLKELDLWDCIIQDTLKANDSLERLWIPYTKVSVWPKMNNSLSDLSLAADTMIVGNLPDSLKRLNLNSCGLKSLPNLPPFLESLACQSNDLSVITALPNSLRFLSCGDNPNLKSLPPLPMLKKLWCSNAPLGNIGKLPSSLVELYCGSIGADTLELTCPVLQELYCVGNKLRSLGQLSDSLKFLICSKNELVYLPKIPAGLLQLDCSQNKLTFLPDLPNTLRMLRCGNNQITCIKSFPGHIQFPDSKHGPYYLVVFPNPLECIPSYHPNMQPAGNFPICTQQQNSECTKITSVSDHEILFWEVYPNPVNDLLYYNGNGLVLDRVHLYDQTGKETFSCDVCPNPIPLHKYPDGIYYLKASVGKSAVSRKIIISR